jgi:ribokinase
MADVVVLGQLGQASGEAADQALALAQLGVPVGVVGVVGDDERGAAVCRRLAAEGVDVSGVAVRSGAPTPTPDDVAAAADQLASCQALAVQLQLPGDLVRAALAAVPATTFVVGDGAPADEATRTAVLARAEVVRAGGAAAAGLAGRELDGIEAARDAAADLLTAGPRLVVLTVPGQGHLVAWRAGPALGVAAEELEADPSWADGEIVVPELPGADGGTGAEYAYVAGLTAALLGRAGPEDAAWVAAAAAALAGGPAGERPALDPASLGETVRRHRGS